MYIKATYNVMKTINASTWGNDIDVRNEASHCFNVLFQSFHTLISMFCKTMESIPTIHLFYCEKGWFPTNRGHFSGLKSPYFVVKRGQN